MRLGVLDVGSNTVHLLVVDAHRGAQPYPQHSAKSQLRLAEHIDGAGRLSKTGADALVRVAIESRQQAEDLGCAELLAFATSAVRDAGNSARVLKRVVRESGVELDALAGEDEARLTFLAVRRWFGWSAGNLICLDIGGGSLELAAGADEDPALAYSVPLGAGRLTRTWFADDPPVKTEIAALRAHVDAVIAEPAARLLSAGAADRVVATSKTFRTLARLAGRGSVLGGTAHSPTVEPHRLAASAWVHLTDGVCGSRRTGRRECRPRTPGTCRRGRRRVRNGRARRRRAGVVPVGTARGCDPAPTRLAGR